MVVLIIALCDLLIYIYIHIISDWRYMNTLSNNSWRWWRFVWLVARRDNRNPYRMCQSPRKIDVIAPSHISLSLMAFLFFFWLYMRDMNEQFHCSKVAERHLYFHRIRQDYYYYYHISLSTQLLVFTHSLGVIIYIGLWHRWAAFLLLSDQCNIIHIYRFSCICRIIFF